MCDGAAEMCTGDGRGRDILFWDQKSKGYVDMCEPVSKNWLQADARTSSLAATSKIWTTAEYGRDVRTV